MIFTKEEKELLVECIEDLKVFEEGYVDVMQDILATGKVAKSAIADTQHQLITAQLKIHKMNELLTKIKGE